MTKFLTEMILPRGSDPQEPVTRARVGRLCGRLGILANAALFAGKLAAGLLSGSVSILADAMNNLADAASSVVTWLGFRLAEKPADEHHPYGHARYEYLSGLGVAVLILFIGFELAKTSVEKILSPEEIRFSLSTAAVLLGSIALKLGLFLLNRSLGKAIGSGTLLAAAADSRNDCLATSAVLLSGALGQAAGVHIDGWAGLGVAVFICFSGLGMARDTISPLLGESASPELQEHLAQALRSSEKVLGYHDLMVHDYGPGQRFASIHVEMDTREDPLACHAIIDRIERECLERHRVHLVIHYDPVVTDDAERNEKRREVELVLRSIHPEIRFHDFRLTRQEEQTLLSFDVILPAELPLSREQVKRQLDTAINLRSDRRYETDITFDQPGLSRDESWE